MKRAAAKAKVRLTHDDLRALLGRTDKEIAEHIRKLGMSGRPAKALDPLRILQLRACGCSLEEIAAELRVGLATLERAKKNDPLIRKILDEGESIGRAQLRSAQHVAAVLQKNPTMLIWLGKNRLGQKDQHEIGGMTDAAGNPTGVPVQFVLTPAQAEMCGDPVSEA